MKLNRLSSMGYFYRRLLILLILAFLSQSVYSQRYFTKSYDIVNGLPTRMVYDICQDSTGLLWLATSEGISCYDGFKFLNYDTKDGLPEQKYKSIKLDEKGNLWCLPMLVSDSLIYYKDNVFNRIEPASKIESLFDFKDFDLYYLDDKIVICIGSNNGIYLFKDNVWKHFNVSEIQSKNIVTKVIANKGKFYLSTGAGLCVFDNAEFDWSLSDKLTDLSKNLLTIEFENKGLSDEKLWALSNNSIGYFEDKNFKVFSGELQFPNLAVSDNAFIGFHSKGRIFFGNGWTKYYIERNSAKIYPLMSNNGFSSNGALSMFIDKEENVWFTDTRGVDKIGKMSLMNYFEINGLLENEVSAITEMNDGKFVIGHNNGLSVLGKDNKFQRIPFKSEQPHSTRVLDMFKDKDGNVWFSANEMGTGKMRPDGVINWYKNSENLFSTSIQQDKNGRIWIGTRSKLFILKDDNLAEYKHNNKISNTNRRIFPSDKGGVYIVGLYGIWYADDNGADKIPSSDGNKADNVYAYYKNKAGIEFIGTTNGLYCIENGVIVKYNKNGVNITNPIYFIIQDRDGYYWLGSNDGVYKWDGDGNVELLNNHNGLAGHETNRAAGILDSKGRVWIGTDLGLSCYLPEFNHSKIPVPKIILYDVEDSKGVQYYLDENNSIPYIDNTLIFNFRGISFLNEDMMVYKYKLEGYDNDWQEVKQSMLDKVKYVNVEPGDYRLNVMVKNFSGEWSEVRRSGTITINSPYYRSYWFYALILLVFGGMVVSIVKIKDQNTQNIRLEKEIKNRKRIEQDLSDSKKKYQDIVELLPEAIYETDINGKFTYANSHGLNLLNFTNDDLIKGIKVEDILSSDDQISMLDKRNMIYGNLTSSRLEYTCISKDGKRIPLSVNAVPIFKDGKMTGIRGVAVDMTEHKKAENTLIKYADDLKSLNASKDKFFSIVAHDLKNPFQGLLGFSDFLHSDYDSLTEEEKKEYIGYIRTTSRNAYNLLDNLLQWSRLQTGRMEIVPVKLNLFSVLNSIIELLTSNFIRKKITVFNNVDKKLFVSTDSIMLNSILQNLISNAVKFTKQNGEVKIESELQEGFIKVKVIDNGVGMSALDISRLFKIDQHISSVGTMNETGTGLGLLLCKEMVELIGGKIFIESEEEKGSEFSFTIPVE